MVAFVVLFGAATLAGAMNAPAGGGSFISLSALLLTGLDAPEVAWLRAAIVDAGVVVVGAMLTIGPFVRAP